MVKLCIVLGLFCLLCVQSKSYSQQLVPAAFREAEIVPDAISRSPVEYLEIQYPSGNSVQLGNILTPTEVKDQPYVSWSADNDGLYTLLMVDLDVPNGEVFHWLVVNIPGCDLYKGQTVMDYLGSAPEKNSGYHRYVFLLFKQVNRIRTNQFIDNRTVIGRIGETTRQLMAKWRLTPVAGNFYFAQWDKYAAYLRELLGI